MANYLKKMACLTVIRMESHNILDIEIRDGGFCRVTKMSEPDDMTGIEIITIIIGPASNFHIVPVFSHFNRSQNHKSILKLGEIKKNSGKSK